MSTSSSNESLSAAQKTPRWMLLLAAVLITVTAYTTFRMVESNGQLIAIERERIALIQDKNRMDAALTAARRQVDELKSLQTNAETEIKKSREDAKSASSQTMQFQERAKSLEGEVGTLRAQVQGAEVERDKLRQDLAAALKAKTDVEARSAALERDLAALTQRLSDAQSRLDELMRRSGEGLRPTEMAPSNGHTPPQTPPAPR